MKTKKPIWKYVGVATGRMTARTPNLSSFPKSTKTRQFFIPDKKPIFTQWSYPPID